MTILIPPKAPNLPLATPEYSRSFVDQMSNVLRLYFNRLDNTNAAVYGPAGGRYIDCPYGLFFDVVAQTLTAPNTAEPVLFRQTYLSNYVVVNSGTDSRIYVDVGGVYNFQFSGQLESTNSSAKTVYFWIARNGAPIGYSTHVYTISGSNTQLEVGWNFDIDMTAGDYIELQWASADTTVQLHATTATAPHPGIPSAVIAINFVAPLPQVIPTPP